MSRNAHSNDDRRRRRIRKRADRALARWLRGDIDKVEFVTTPSGEQFVDQYNRDPNAGAGGDR